MQGYKLLFRNISPYDVADFDKRNHTAPYPQALRNMYCWQQLKQRHSYKNEVGNSIQLASKLAGAVCFSGDCSIYHITKSAKEIYDINATEKAGKNSNKILPRIRQAVRMFAICFAIGSPVNLSLLN